MAVGVDQGCFQRTARGRLSRRLLVHVLCHSLELLCRRAHHCAAKLCESCQTGGPALAADFGEGCGFPITLRTVSQRDSDEEVFCNGARPRCDHERIREGDIDWPEFDLLNDWSRCCHCSRHLNEKPARCQCRTAWRRLASGCW